MRTRQVAPRDGLRPTRRVAPMILLLAALSIVPLGLLGWSSVRVSTDAVRRQAEERVASTAEASAAAVQQQLDGLAALVQSYAQRPSLTSALGPQGSGSVDPGDVRHQLDQLRGALPGIDLAFLADPAGTLVDIIPETPSIVGQSFNHRDWYRGVMATGRPYVSEVYATAATGGGLVVAAAAPVRADADPSSPVTAIVVVGYRLDTIQPFVDRFAAAQGVSLTVTDQQGTLIAAPGPTPTTMTSLAGDAGVRAALEGRRGVGERDVAGEPMLSAHAPVPGLGWTVTADVPTSSALHDVTDVRRAVFGLSALLGCVLVAGLILIARTMARRAGVEHDLEQSETFLGSVVENIPNMVFVKEADELRFVRFNRAGAQLIGTPAEEVLGRNDHDLFPASQADDFVAADRKVLEGGVLVDIPEERLQTREKGERILHTKRFRSSTSTASRSTSSASATTSPRSERRAGPSRMPERVPSGPISPRPTSCRG